ncbi:MAG: glycosyltransferase family 4 protein [bacterium]|nr:glycosyltransferase family 4 protein [bacterium]
MTKKKRILTISLAWYPFESGGESAPRFFIDRMKGYDVDVVTYRFKRSMPRKEQVGKAMVYRVGGINKYDWMFRAFLKAMWLQYRQPYDCVWSIMAAYAGGVAYWFKRFHPQVPLVITLQEGDPVAHILKRVGIVGPWFRDLFVRADRVHAISTYLGGVARDMGFLGTPIIIPNGVDIDAFKKVSSKIAFPKRGSQVVLINTSRLVYKNAHDIVIRALAYLPPNVVYKNVAQQGDLHDELVALAEKIGVADRVHLESGLTLAEIPEWLQGGDIFVRPSRSEGLGTSFIEAMAAGLPIIATPVGGIIDFLHDEETGLFSLVEDPKSVAHCVTRLMNDDQLRERIKEGARLAAQKYDWDDLSLRMIHLFDTVGTHDTSA